MSEDSLCDSSWTLQLDQVQILGMFYVTHMASGNHTFYVYVIIFIHKIRLVIEHTYVFTEYVGQSVSNRVSAYRQATE